jgi:TRAP-type C4-dicarboxylate transport system permease small subunit
MTDSRDEAAPAGKLVADGWRIPNAILLTFGGAAILALMLLSVTDALLRTFFNAPLFGAQEVARMMLAAAVAFGVPAGIVAGQSITIDIVAERLPPRIARPVEKLVLVLAAAIMVLVAWRCAVNGMAAARFGEATVLLSIPYGPFYYCLAAGFAAAALANLAQARRA